MSKTRRVAGVALALLIAACSDAPMAPQSHSPTAAGEVSKLAVYTAGTPLSTSNFAVRTIGPAGGTISLAGFELVVPPGAVSKATEFSISLPDGGRHVWASFEPRGVRFNTAIILRAPYLGTSAEGNSIAHVVWFDGSTWTQLPTTLTQDGGIQTQTTQLSDYGTQETTDPAKGIEPVGG